MRCRLGLILLILWAAGSPSAFCRGDRESTTYANSTFSTYFLPSESDTIKYRGYRLNLLDFKVVKKNGDWIKIQCTIVNSGRMDVNMGKEGTEHWVQMNFDQSLFEQKLGGFRENIRYALAENGFKLEAGAVLREFELKVSTTLPVKPRPEPPISFSENTPPQKTSETVAAKGGDDDALVEEDKDARRKDACPDIFFSGLRIVEQDDKWATLEYTITNQGKGIFHVFGERAGEEDNLAVRAYISGVPVLSRGALPVGGQLVAGEGRSGDLLPGDSYTGTLKLDIRKKTRYLKSLILSLESYQFADECDKTNNTGAVVLD